MVLANVDDGERISSGLSSQGPPTQLFMCAHLVQRLSYLGTLATRKNIYFFISIKATLYYSYRVAMG